MAGKTELELLLTATNRASGPIGAVGRSLKGLNEKAGRARSALGPLNRLVGGGLKIAAAGAATAVVGLGAVIGTSVSAAADMEQQIANISATMGLAADETDALNDLILDLGVDPNLKVSATEAADAIEMLGKNGLTMDQIMDGAAKSTVLLANSTGAEFGQAADIATDVMAQFNIKADDMASAVNGITGVTKSSKFDIDDYGLAIAQAGGVAGSVGVDFDDFNATIAAISPNFASGSDAGTSFKTFLQRLKPSSAPATEAMKELGLITEESGNRFFDAQGNMKSMEEIAGIMEGAFEGLSESQRISAASTIFGTDAMRAAFGIADAGSDTIAEMKNTIGKTDAEEAAATRMDTFRGTMEILSGVVETLRLKIGQAFLPVVRRMAERFTELISDHGPAITAMFETLAGKTEEAVSKFIPWVDENLPRLIEQLPSVVAKGKELWQEFVKVSREVWNAIEPVLKFIGGLSDLKGVFIAVGGLMAVSFVAQAVTFISGIVSAVGAVASFVGGLSGIATTIGTVIAAINPVTLAIAAVVAAIVGLALAWKNNWFDIQGKTRAAVEWLEDFLGDIPGNLQKFWDDFKEWAEGAMERMREGFTGMKDRVGDGLNTVMDWLQRKGDERMPEWAQNMHDAGANVIGRLGEGLVSAREGVKAEIQRVLSDIEEHGVGYAAGAFAGRMITSGREALKKFGDGMGETVPGLRTKIGNALNAVRDKFNELLPQVRDRILEGGKQFLQGFRDGLNAAAPNLLPGIDNALGNLRDRFNSWIDTLRERVFGGAQGLMQRTADGLRSINLGDAITGAWEHLVSVFNGWMEGLRTRFFDGAKSLMQHASDGLRNINIGEAMSQAWEHVVNVFNGWMETLRGHVFGGAASIMQRIVAGLLSTDLGGGMAQAIQNIITVFNEMIGSFRTHVYSAMTGVGSNLVGGMIDGIGGQLGNLRDRANEAADTALDSIKSRLGIQSPSRVMRGLGNDMMAGLVQGLGDMADAPANLLGGIGADLQATMAGAAAGATTNTISGSYNRTTQNTFNLGEAGGAGGGADYEDRRLQLLNTLSSLYAR